MRLILGTLLASTFVTGAANQASAQPGKVMTPGEQDAAPGPAAPVSPPIAADDGLRWAIRGCPVEMQCAHKTLEAALLEFEREAFPKPGDSPWVDSDAGAKVTARASSNAPSARASKPSDLGKHLAWMDELRLPDLPLVWDKRVIAFLEFYKDDPRGRRLMTAWLRRQGRYRPMILAHLEKAKLPRDLLYVAMIESSYDPTEYSRAGASGLWQLMPSGATIFGLERNRWLDERNDPVKSTEAAMLYFADLEERFGNWDLAMAAYNAGYGAVLNGMSKYNTNDFWQLLEYENALPWESSIYVPKALAAAIVGNNLKAFGFDTIEMDAELTWDNVTVPQSVSLASIARAAGTQTDTIKELNPQLRSGRTPPGVKDYVVRIPRGQSQVFATRFAQIQGEWDNHATYLVRHGQRFEDVATEFGISRSDLRELNGVTTEAEIGGGTTLVVPKRSAAERAANLKAAQDDLYASGVPKGDPGDKLIVAVPDPGYSVDGKKRLFYRVVAGNSLWSIGAAFGVSVGDLVSWNKLVVDAKLHPRMVLQVWVPPTFSPEAKEIAVLDPSRLTIVSAGSVEHIEKSEQHMGRERVVIVVQKGDTLEKIGKKFGLTARDMARINNIAFDAVLSIGQEVVAYKVVDSSASKRAAEQHKAASPKKR